MKLTLPTDSVTRKDVPLYSGCYSYFPAALAGVAMHSKAGNDKHNPGEVLHHARGKSMDHADCIARHSMDLADMLADFVRRAEVLTPEKKDAILIEADALCWRALAWSQELHEQFNAAPMAPAARGETKCYRKGEEVKSFLCEQMAPAARLPVTDGKTREVGRGPEMPVPRPHTTWCGLDTDHTGMCLTGPQKPKKANPDAKQAASESLCSGQQYAESRRTPGPSPLDGLLQET